ncbi:NAD(P)/FAD-dependent oxidoreductase [Atopomonas sediminilitoris]|uniref:NAD(P)/FAD-dependent oxidoreductase n=1 Tax=Atopomonas sediminilitoris TaxID=2919919 RepID=UPI001F4E4244|nr:FAD-dependent oxidoreductase [Atopomonas sediminilitoris]MCJ8168086.1 FAD-dependent oxidoreductase [Atopomonas sediminilitoris]
MPKTIAIIGAGIAGLAAAQALRASRRKVIVFDKSRGSGGRLSSKRSEVGNLDLGAQYFTARERHFSTQVQVWRELGLVDSWQPHLYQSRHGVLSYSADEQQRFVGTPRMSALTRSLCAGIDCQFATRISTLENTPQGWLLHDSEGQPHGPFSHVIVATPAPQAVPLLAASQSLSQAAAAVAMLPTWAVALQFAAPLATPVEACFVQHNPLDWIARSQSKPGREHSGDVWIGHGSSAWSAAHLELSPDEICEHLRGALAEVLGCTVPAPTWQLAHRWLYARPEHSHDHGALADPAMGLYACGDWCNGGRVEGAWLSGREAARLLLEQGH